LNRGDDLAGASRRQRRRQPGQGETRQPEGVAQQAGDQHPRAEGAGQQHGEGEDQRGVRLHVEARAGGGGGARAPGDPAVHGVERQRDRREQRCRGDGLAGSDRDGGEPGDPGRQHGPDEGDLVGRAEARCPGREVICGVHTLIHVASRRAVRSR